jgi:thiamine biosynthesis lipoprotein
MCFKSLKRSSVILLFVFLLSACQQAPEKLQYPLHYSDAIFGTSFTIKAPALPGSITSAEIQLKVKQLLDKLNAQMSTYQQDSELSKINQNQTGEWIAVSDALYQVLKQANTISELSSGAFDITVGPLVNLWGFGPKGMSFVAPDEEKIKQQLLNTGYKRLLFNDDKQQIKKQVPLLYLDLSAIAKGYAVDLVGALLEANGIVDYMVEIGGELRLKGLNIQRKSWRIAVEKPTADQRMIQKVLPLTDISLATSGDYRNFFEVEGVRFSHTIDPRSGKPITHKLASITILSDTTMKADALATALMVLGVEQGYRLAEKENIAALFIIKTKEGFIEKATDSFVARLR